LAFPASSWRRTIAFNFFAIFTPSAGRFAGLCGFSG
jgi:hypothetical protein